MEFREMRRKRQQLTPEESIDILENATAGTLALLGDGNYPYAVPSVMSMTTTHFSFTVP